MLLTHAHLDHCGLLPKLVKEGFRGRIFCTAATAEIARYVLLDSARLQEEDAAFKQARHEREGRAGPHPVQPLYNEQDVQQTLPLFSPVPYGQPLEAAAGVLEWRPIRTLPHRRDDVVLDLANVRLRHGGTDG